MGDASVAENCPSEGFQRMEETMHPLVKTVKKYRIIKQKLQRVTLEKKLPMKEITPLVLGLLGSMTYLETEMSLLMETAKRLVIQKGIIVMTETRKNKLMETVKRLVIKTNSE